MFAQAFENKNTENGYEYNGRPEYGGHRPAFPEPHLVDKRIPVPLYDIVHRVGLENIFQRFGKHVRVPENRGDPETDLEDDINDGYRILEKHGDGRSNPAQPLQQDKQCEHII